MPSPIAHSAAAYLLYRRARRTRPDPPPEASFGTRLLSELTLLGTLLFLSLLPDLDSLVGLLAGDFGAYHNGGSHSFFAGFVVAVLVGMVAALTGRVRFHVAAAWTFVAYTIHVVMDYLTVGRGVMLLWPFDDGRLTPPMHAFYGLRWSEGWWTSDHLLTLVNELGWLALVLLAVHLRPPERGG
jgi:membrane-bound metal-dependent hydrolase YbcI (DUF457 family)